MALLAALLLRGTTRVVQHGHAADRQQHVGTRRQQVQGEEQFQRDPRLGLDGGSVRARIAGHSARSARAARQHYRPRGGRTTTPVTALRAFDSPPRAGETGPSVRFR